MANWRFLCNHGRALLCIANDSEVRLRDIASSLGVTERHASAIVTELTKAGYVVKEKNGRRNRYQIQEHLPVPDTLLREPAVGDVLSVFIDHKPRRRSTAGHAPKAASRGT